MIIVDANVIAYLVIESRQTPLAELVAQKDTDWRAPRLWRSEMLNVLAGYIRNGTLSAQSALSCFDDAHSAITSDVETDETAVLELVGVSQCSSYDCEYVAAAKKLRVPLVTADKQLLKSFPLIAVSMMDFTSR